MLDHNSLRKFLAGDTTRQEDLIAVARIVIRYKDEYGETKEYVYSCNNEKVPLGELLKSIATGGFFIAKSGVYFPPHCVLKIEVVYA